MAEEMSKFVENKKTLGQAGEEFAMEFLRGSGLSILARNYRCPKGEIDIIARDREELVFVEVRTRRSSFRGWGEESITYQKASRLKAVASYFIIQQGYINWPKLRFDVVAVRWIKASPEARWIQGAL